MTFNKSFKFSLHGNLYHAYVEGVVTHDENDNNVTYSEIDTVVLEDDDGNLVDESHNDYEDLMSEVESRDFQPDFNW